MPPKTRFQEAAESPSQESSSDVFIGVNHDLKESEDSDSVEQVRPAPKDKSDDNVSLEYFNATISSLQKAQQQSQQNFEQNFEELKQLFQASTILHSSKSGEPPASSSSDYVGEPPAPSSSDYVGESLASSSSANTGVAPQSSIPASVLSSGAREQSASAAKNDSPKSGNLSDDCDSQFTVDPGVHFDSMDFNTLHATAQSLSQSTLQGVVENISSHFDDNRYNKKVLQAYCTVGHALQHGLCEELSHSSLVKLFRPLPVVHDLKDLTVTLSSEQHMDIDKNQPKCPSEQYILDFFRASDGSNVLMTATHWTAECQRRWEKLLKDTFRGSPFPPHVLGLGSLNLALLSQSAAPWSGEVEMSNAATGDGSDIIGDIEDYGDVVDFAGSPDRDPSFVSQLSPAEKGLANLWLSKPLPHTLHQALNVLTALPTSSIIKGKSQLSSSALVAARKWDAAQKVIAEIVIVMLKSMEASKLNQERSTASGLSLVNELSPQGAVFGGHFFNDVPTVVGRVLKARYNIKGTEGAHAFSVLKKVVNSGSHLGGVSEIRTLFSTRFVAAEGLVSYGIRMNELLRSAQQNCPSLPGDNGAPNPVCSEAVGLWVVMSSVQAVRHDRENKKIQASTKRFLKKLHSDYMSGKIRTFNDFLKIAESAEHDGHFPRLVASESQRVAYGAQGDRSSSPSSKSKKGKH